MSKLNSKSKSCFFVFILFSLFVLFPAIVNAKKNTKSSICAETIFSTMENRADNINTIIVEATLKDSRMNKEVKLAIKSPNKFAIIFDDNTVGVYFNGTNLWFYIKRINEAFYYFSKAKNSILSYLPMINPKKLFTSLTKKTLFSLFEVKLTDTSIIKSDTSKGKKLVHYTLKFTPKMKTLFKQVFSVGHYYMVFSNHSYLPVRVSEFSALGIKRGELIIKQYRIDEKIDEKVFNFTPPIGVVLTPISVILARKLEEYGNLVATKMSNYSDKLKQNIMDWSF